MLDTKQPFDWSLLSASCFLQFSSKASNAFLAVARLSASHSAHEADRSNAGISPKPKAMAIARPMIDVVTSFFIFIFSLVYCFLVFRNYGGNSGVHLLDKRGCSAA